MEIKGIDIEKIGMDSSAIICLAVNSNNLNEFKEKNYKLEKKIYFSVESEAEVIGVLINKYSFSPDKARTAWDMVSKEINLNLIRWGNKSDNKNIYFDAIKDVNKIVSDIYEGGKIIGDMDIKIISSFWFGKMNSIYTLDKAFEKTCKGLKFQILSFPNEFIYRMNLAGKMED